MTRQGAFRWMFGIGIVLMTNTPDSPHDGFRFWVPLVVGSLALSFGAMFGWKDNTPQ